jgi:predicted amidohydrolase YtcJ
MTKFRKTISTLVIIIAASCIAAYAWLGPPHSPNNMIFFGGDIVTVNPLQPNAEAIYIENGIITGIGTLAEMQNIAPKGTKQHNLGGATLLPGLIEPHTHPIASAQFAATIDVSGFTHKSRAEVMHTLEQQVGDSTGAWAIAFGWDPVMMDDLEPPTLGELDALSPDKPLLILTQMMHDAYANSAALKAAGITTHSTNPPAGEFVRNENGALTGTVREVGAISVLLAAMPPPPTGSADLLLNLQFGAYARAGYTTIGVAGPVGNVVDPLALLTRRAQAPGAPVQAVVYALPHQINAATVPQKPNGPAPVIGVKFWMDGSPYAGGAAVEEPYENSQLSRERLHLEPGHRGAVMIADDEFEKQFTLYHIRGFQIATHVQGERAIDRVLDVAARVLAVHPRADHRHRLEHNALITPEQLARAHALGFTTSFFIDHILFYGTKLPDLFGVARTARYMPMNSAIKAGHRVTFHGDHPATPIGPLRSFKTAISRMSRMGNTAVGNDEAISRMDALRAMTINAAWQLGLEKQRGSLEVGKAADLTILSANPLTINEDEIPHITIQETWIAGTQVDPRKTTRTNAQLAWQMLLNFF